MGERAIPNRFPLCGFAPLREIFPHAKAQSFPPEGKRGMITEWFNQESMSSQPFRVSIMRLAQPTKLLRVATGLASGGALPAFDMSW